MSLLNHMVKALLSIILNRLQHKIEPFLVDEQAGFRSDRGTVHQILALRLITEKVLRKQGRSLHNCFVDYTKAFDTVLHENLYAVLASYGVGAKIIRVIRAIYESEQSAVRIDGQLGAWWHPEVGTRQEGPLSPYLFITYLERVSNK